VYKKVIKKIKFDGKNKLINLERKN